MKNTIFALLVLLNTLSYVMSSASAQEPGKPKLRGLTYNIHHGQGTDGKFDYERLARIIIDLKPDIVALQEVDRGTRRADGVDQAEKLAQLTGMKAYFGNAMHFSGGEYGEAILSRFPVKNVKSFRLPFRFGLESRAAISGIIQPDNGLPEFQFLGTHLCHQSGENRLDQVKQLHKLVGGNQRMPVILAGDFNARPGSEPMQYLLQNGWKDAVSPKSIIDYVLLQSDDPWKVVEVRILDEPVASDHDPVLVVLEW
ncbi:MAG TPA: endonuclease [Verrucomicrobia bacterium]|nr:endonuclease [Verrucomicrobiota bacterium]